MLCGYAEPMSEPGKDGPMIAPCYPRNVNRFRRLVGLVLVAVLSGTPAFAAVCAELCGLSRVQPVASGHCSRHTDAPPVDVPDDSRAQDAHHASKAAHHSSIRQAAHHGDARITIAVLPGASECCRGRSAAVAAAPTPPRSDAGAIALAVTSGTRVPLPIPPIVPRALHRSASFSPALSRAPFVLRI